jgi:hypothetical protein
MEKLTLDEAPSEAARMALVGFIEDHAKSVINLTPERAADMLLIALWIEGFKLVPLTKEDKRAHD